MIKIQGTSYAALLGLALFAAACGGGGGGGSSVSGSQLLVEANVSRDTCNERLAPVRQVFTFSDGAADTGILTIPTVEVDGATTGGFEETSGECTRRYSVEFRDQLVTLLSQTTCPTSACETEWRGTASEVVVAAPNALETKISGENCNPNIPSTVAYRPSAFECNGNSAILMGANQRNNHSVVVRRNGQFNDRDPNNPTCSTNRCSPYKTQKRIELPQYQVNCLGASGFSPEFSSVLRMSIKYTAQITNKNDTGQFEQYCLNNVQADLN